jgi:hypothetical protein
MRKSRDVCFGFNSSSQNQDINVAPTPKKRKTRDEVGAEKLRFTKGLNASSLTIGFLCLNAGRR